MRYSILTIRTSLNKTTVLIFKVYVNDTYSPYNISVSSMFIFIITIIITTTTLYLHLIKYTVFLLQYIVNCMKCVRCCVWKHIHSGMISEYPDLTSSYYYLPFLHSLCWSEYVWILILIWPLIIKIPIFYIILCLYL